MKTTLALILSASLVACGGGSTPTLPDNSKAITTALGNIASKYPDSKAFTGGYMAVNGVPVGLVAGTSPEAVVKDLAQRIIDSPTSLDNTANYKLLLSDQGLKITMYGESTGISTFGLVQKGNDTIYTVTSRTDGLHVVW